MPPVNVFQSWCDYRKYQYIVLQLFSALLIRSMAQLWMLFSEVPGVLNLGLNQLLTGNVSKCSKINSQSWRDPFLLASSESYAHLVSLSGGAISQSKDAPASDTCSNSVVGLSGLSACCPFTMPKKPKTIFPGSSLFNLLTQSKQRKHQSRGVYSLMG